MSDRGCWVYGVADHDPGQELSGLSGVAGGAVRAAPAGGLTALVSDVDLDEFGADALARNLEDLDWLERVARAHHHVIETASRAAPVLPVGLTTVYTSEPSMAAAFAERRRDFMDALALVRDRAEWGVKVYARPERAETERSEPGRGEPEHDSGTGTGSGAGLAYLKRRRTQLNAAQDSRRDAAAAVSAVHSALAGHAALTRVHPPQSSRLSGASAPMLLNAAYLLDEADEAGFQAAVIAEANTHPELSIEVTGPWPPYSFAGEAARGDGDTGDDWR
jgi:gas vesicle protein GvpL/GvpF